MATLPIAGWDALYRATDQPKNMILSFSDGTTLRNPQIVLEQMSLEESLCSEENLRFGCCESSCFQIRVVNNEQSFEGLYLNVVQTFPPQLVRLIGSDDSYIIDDQGDYISGADIFYAQYGNFLVVSDKPTGDRQYRDLTCYDKMYEIIHANVIEWYDGLTFPISVKDFRDSFFEYLNVAQVENDLINDDFMIQGEFYVSEELSGRMVIESICELNGAFGHINRDGLFEYITLPTEDSLTYPHYVNGTCAYEDYETEAITGIRAINVEGDSGTVVGTEVNPYIMQSNILTFGSEGSEELMDALNNMLDLVSQFTYTPFKVTTYGNPMLPLGTNVTFETRYKTINSFVMTRYLSGLQALRDTFTTLGDRMYPQDVNRIKNEIQRSGGLTHKLTNDVNTLDSEIFDEHGNSRIQQTLDEIVLKVDTDGNLVQAELGTDPDTVQTYFKVGADNISFIANDTIELTTNNLEINSTNFRVDSDGNLACSNADVSGTITSNNGEIGLLSISEYGLECADMYIDNNSESAAQLRFGGTRRHRTGLIFNSSGITANNWDGWTKTILSTVSGPGGGVQLQADILAISGSKSRIVNTKDYGERLLYCYETPTPMFGDIGEGQIANDGKCYVWLDPTFAQTISDTQYQVFLQKYGQGECWVSERKPNYFVVEGTQGLSFGWEIKAKQFGYEMNRLDRKDDWNISNTDYGELAERYINNIQNESEVA